MTTTQPSAMETEVLDSNCNPSDRANRSHRLRLSRLNKQRLKPGVTHDLTPQHHLGGHRSRTSR